MDESQRAQQTEALRARREAELRVRQVLAQILEPAAMERLANIKLADAEAYQQIAGLVASLYQQGQIKNKITEEQLKQIASKLSSRKREPTITFARK